MDKLRYTTRGVCARAIEIELKGNIIENVRFEGGCQGNTQGVARLVIGRKVEEVIALLKGISCRNGTSCPDQLARALEQTTKIIV